MRLIPVIKKLIDRYRFASAKGRALTEPTLEVKGTKASGRLAIVVAVPLTTEACCSPRRNLCSAGVPCC